MMTKKVSPLHERERKKQDEMRAATKRKRKAWKTRRKVAPNGTIASFVPGGRASPK